MIWRYILFINLEKYNIVGKLLKPGDEPTNYDEENAKLAAQQQTGDKKNE